MIFDVYPLAMIGQIPSVVSRRRLCSYVSPSEKGNHPHLAAPFEREVFERTRLLQNDAL